MSILLCTFVSRKVTNIKYKPLKITTMKKMLVLSFALSLFAVSSVMANDSTLDADRSPKRVNVNLVIGTPPPPPHNCCDHHRPAPQRGRTIVEQVATNDDRRC